MNISHKCIGPGCRVCAALTTAAPVQFAPVAGTIVSVDVFSGIEIEVHPITSDSLGGTAPAGTVVLDLAGASDIAGLQARIERLERDNAILRERIARYRREFGDLE